MNEVVEPAEIAVVAVFVTVNKFVVVVVNIPFVKVNVPVTVVALANVFVPLAETVKFFTVAGKPKVA